MGEQRNKQRNVAELGVLNLLRRVEVEVEGTLLAAAAAPTLLYSGLEGRKYQTRGILQLPPAGRAGAGLGPPTTLLHIYLQEISWATAPPLPPRLRRGKY